jgi:molybdopterin molybdotransferase
MALTPLSEALEKILSTVSARPEAETVGLSAALKRFVATQVHSSQTVPPADNSAMDGYAVRSEDVPGVLPISQRIPAGHPPSALTPGTAARIFTGAVVPEGADAVILQEDAQQIEDTVQLPEAVTGQHIRRRGDDIQRGDRLVAQGQCLQPQDIGLLASVGIADVSVFRPLTVAILTTGDELREPGSGDLAPGQIYNSNRVSLAALIEALGMIPVDLGNVVDEPEMIGAALERAAVSADCIVTAGGVSVGEEDHVRGQIEARGTLTLWKLAIKPGKPLAFGEVMGTPIFGLPGNPVSAWVTFVLVAKPFLIKRQGGVVSPEPRFPVRSGFSVARPGSREEFVRIRLIGCGEAMRATLTGSQSSGVLTSLSQADGFAVIPAGTTVSEGDWLEVISMAALGQPGAGAISR